MFHKSVFGSFVMRFIEIKGLDIMLAFLDKMDYDHR